MVRTPQLEEVERLYLNAFPDTTAGIDELRRNYDDLMLQFELPSDFREQKIDAGGVPALKVDGDGTDGDKVFVWLHGGGYTLGSPNGFKGMGYYFAKASGRSVILPDYRLAPENPFPAPLDDGITALRWAIGEYGAENVVVGGDSGGAGMAAAAVASLRDSGGGVPAGVVLLSMLADLAVTGESIDTNADKDISVSRASINNLVPAYLQGGEDLKDPRVSPLYGDVAGFPPTLLLVGSTEALLDDSRRMTEKLTAAGVDATLSIYDDMVHVWPLFTAILPEGQRAADEIGEFVRAAR